MRITNDEIADVLEQIADLLEAQHASSYRVRAYRRASAFARSHEEPLVEVLEREGRKGLIALPTIGESVARLIAELHETGRSRQLARLEGEVTAEELFDTLPGIGSELAERIHDTLHVETLEELELAADDGRLETVPGIGAHRSEMIRNALSARLRDQARARARAAEAHRPQAHPSVELLLDLDAEYRRRAAAGELRRIAPRRHNPEGKAWLPILHVERDGWELTALFSNTARAHELGRTDDWVVIAYERDHTEGLCTVVTETHGPREGRRVVRGREREGSRPLADSDGS